MEHVDEIFRKAREPKGYFLTLRLFSSRCQPRYGHCFVSLL